MPGNRYSYRAHSLSNENAAASAEYSFFIAVAQNFGFAQLTAIWRVQGRSVGCWVAGANARS